jgi:hypothetical protein
VCSVRILTWKRACWIEVKECEEQFDYELTGGDFAWFLV